MRKPSFIGVYSRPESAGRGKRLYFVWQKDTDDFIVQELDRSLAPHGPVWPLKKKDLAANFRFEPEILAAPVSRAAPETGPAMRPEEKAGGVAELTPSTLARLEKARRARQIENDMRENFKKALRGLNRPRDRQGALVALEQLARAREGIGPAHRHMFRDFGVSLRKKSLLELALICARRVLELTPDDDHAHFNMARILSLLGAPDRARAHLQRAMMIDPSEPVYSRFLEYLSREQFPGGRKTRLPKAYSQG